MMTLFTFKPLFSFFKINCKKFHLKEKMILIFTNEILQVRMIYSNEKQFHYNIDMGTKDEHRFLITKLHSSVYINIEISFFFVHDGQTRIGLSMI
jgi:hypothetical protein